MEILINMSLIVHVLLNITTIVIFMKSTKTNGLFLSQGTRIWDLGMYQGQNVFVLNSRVNKTRSKCSPWSYPPYLIHHSKIHF